jgi:CTP synthase
MNEQRSIVQKGGTMRLGAYPCSLQDGTHAAKLYGQSQISERHRHRYEFNNEYRERYAAKGMTFSGLSPDGGLVEIIEIRKHPWFIGVQFHPELKSRPFDCHPLFAGFVRSALQRRLGIHESPLRRVGGAGRS